MITRFVQAVLNNFEINSPAANNEVESEQYPWQVHRLEPRAEPERYDDVFVELAPHVQHWEDHGVHEDLEQVTE